jgi:competence protein ComEA
VLARFRSVLANPWGQAGVAATALCLLLVAVTLIFTSRRQETIVLDVEQAIDPNLVRVYVGGEVRQPGLYTLSRGSRVADALAAAGGATDLGDTTALGMAAVLEDADQIIVGARVVPLVDPAGSTSVVSGNVPAAAAPININSASETELEALPGIGPALAARIVEHRERNGPFRSVDELEIISGISDRMVDELRPYLSIGP